MNRAAAFLITLSAITSPLAAETSPSPTPTESSLISEADARLELSRMLRDDKRIAEAIAEYQKLIESAPDRIDIRLELAELHAACHDADAAMKVLAPIPPAELGARGQLLLTNLALQKNDFAQAEKLLRVWLETNPDDLKVRLQLADVLSWAKRYNESAAEFDKLLAARPNDVQLRRHYARMLGWANKRDEAIKQWKLSLAAPAE